MSQTILKNRTGHLASYTFFTRYVNQYKKRHFHNSVNHQENLFHRKLITEVFKNTVLQKNFRSSRLRMSFTIGEDLPLATSVT